MAFNANLLTKQQLLNIHLADWCYHHNIVVSDLESHPQIDDLVLLLKIKKQYHYYMTKSHHSIWGAIWEMTYTKKKKISSKNLNKLEKLVLDSENNLLYTDITRNNIHALRQNTK